MALESVRDPSHMLDDMPDHGQFRGKKALITGASGFIGGSLRDALLRQGADVISLRRHGSPQSSEGRSAEVDYADHAGLENLIRQEQPEYLFHVAGATKGVSYADFEKANVQPTENLARAFKAANKKGERFVFVSSLAAYGPSPGRQLVESDPRKPIEYYGKSKHEAEQVLEDTMGDLPWTTLRPGGVYGPGDRDYFKLFESAAKGFNVFFGNRKRQFSAVFVDDLVRAILDAALSDNTLQKGYFICDGVPVTWEDFQAYVVQSAQRKVRDVDLPGFLVNWAAVFGELQTKVDGKPRLFNKQRAIMGVQDAWTCRHDAAKNDFGYTPSIEQQEGVARAFDWYRQQGWV